ncbi:hypothetical protein BDP27DRAFT_1375529 [Rhodocollybia butyracea]|uniref:Uncharacterized protein n=1 Tax=Rhodocollybia butyracea TaxID=206335 RepID=A0A9P5P136_9AGAR|nr:hypothetical protein BDP27DRAFT_1375529 [Rhodocollybia butyracea]
MCSSCETRYSCETHYSSSSRLRIKLLKQRASRRALSSGKPLNASQLQAVRDLCSEVEWLNLNWSWEKYVDILPVLFHFLTQHQPPSKATASTSLTDVETTSLEILYNICIGFGCRKTAHDNCRVVVSLFQQSLPDIFAWSSFLVESYVDGEHMVDEELEDATSRTIGTIALLFEFLLAEDGIQLSQDMQKFQYAGDLIVRVHLYTLVRIDLTLPHTSAVVSHFSLGIFENLLPDLLKTDSFWTPLYDKSVRDLNPRLIPLFVRTLSRLVQEPSLNYGALIVWIGEVRRFGPSEDRWGYLVGIYERAATRARRIKYLEGK